MPRNRLKNGKIYVQFDDHKAGNTKKDRRLPGDFKECVPITAETKPFGYKRGGKTTLSVQRKQFPLILPHAITIHKSQGSTLDYMLGDLDGTTDKGPNVCRIKPGQLYTLLSRAKSRDKIKLLNFDENHVLKKKFCNEKAREEMERMRSESVFTSFGGIILWWK